MAMEEGIGTNPVSGKVNKYTHDNRIVIYQLKFEKKICIAFDYICEEKRNMYIVVLFKKMSCNVYLPPPPKLRTLKQLLKKVYSNIFVPMKFI